MKTITISGEIGWEVMPADIRAALDDAKGADLDVHIASPGGFIFDGLEIFNAIRDYKRKYPEAELMATIKGVAASMASYIAMNPAFSMVTAEDNAVFMIHNGWMGAVGDYRDMRKAAEILEGLDNLLDNAYVRKTGKSKEEIRAMMDEETWLFGDEIKSAGFVDDIVKTDDEKEKSTAMKSARVKFQSVAVKVNSAEAKYDFSKIAAMIKPDYSDKVIVVNNISNPAQPREKITEVKTMTLDQLMAENPAAKIELDNRIKAATDAGFENGKKSMQAAVSAASKYLTPGSAYPAAIKTIAVDVLDGKKSVEALETTVSAFDALRESGNSAAAKEESAKVGETPGQQAEGLSPDGEMNTELDVMAQIKRDKLALGQEV